MLKVREDIFFLNNDFSPPRMIILLKLIGNERTNDSVLTIVKSLKHKYLLVLNVRKVASCDKSDPISFSLGCMNNAANGFPVISSNGIGICRNTSYFLKRFFRR